MENNNDILELDDAYVLSYYDRNSKYGEALSIDILDDPNDPESDGNKIDTWLKHNGDERGTNGTKVLTDKYTGNDYMPFYFKITAQTKIIDLDGKKVSKDELVKGAGVGLVARAVPYEYEGRSGISRPLEMIVVYEPKNRTQTNLEHITKMRADRLARERKAESSETTTDKPSADSEEKPSSDTTNPPADPEVDLSRIPF
ncbi:hypothetical protein IKF92_01340 [Candidatus Saccharibacteria bacterium]|nr:hypothetical protein [Candidatus Saccharibacteria bacterium]